jgi:uncharacterized protein YbbC (DUF1343 family)
MSRSSTSDERASLRISRGRFHRVNYDVASRVHSYSLYNTLHSAGQSSFLNMFRDRSHSMLIRAIRPGAIWTAVLASFIAAPLPRASGQSPSPASSYTASGHTLTGIDVLEQENFALLRGKRIGLITNQTGVDSQGRRTIDVLAKAPGVKLVALFSPEHGATGTVDTPSIGNSVDSATHLPVFSLYGETRKPTPEMLKGLDALVFDVQDAGVRFYTYITTMAYAMEAASNHVALFVLDRPDPIGGEVIEGPMLDPGRTSFVGYFPMPVRYAMTMGELAQMFNRENKIGADLHVVAMKNWRRNEAYDQTGLRWIAPSPNLRTVNAAFLYPGIEILQAGGVSVGRGTGAPFEILGAPWIRADQLLAALNSRKISGVTFSAAQFTPAEDLYKGQVCEGVTITLTDRAALSSMSMGLIIADVLNRLYPQQFHLDKMMFLAGSQSTIDRLQHGDDPAQIVAGWAADLDRFRQMRAQYLLYH